MHFSKRVLENYDSKFGTQLKQVNESRFQKKTHILRCVFYIIYNNRLFI